MMRTLWTLAICQDVKTAFRCSWHCKLSAIYWRTLETPLKPIGDRSATSRRSVANQSRIISDQSPINRRRVDDQSRNSRRLIADRSQQGCQISEPKCWWNRSATDRWLVGDWSANSRKPLQPVCDQNQSRLVLCAFSKDWLRLILFGDLSATSLRPL